MATVRQSITELYEESRKSAVEGAPMIAVIDTIASGDAPSGNGKADVRPLAAPEPAAIVARFEELRRLAEVEASPSEDSRDMTRDVPENASRDNLRNTPVGALSTDLPRADMPDTDVAHAHLSPPSFGGEPTDASFDHEEALPSAPVMSGEPDGIALPEEPPAPVSTPVSGDDADLEIGDIQELVRQAWEDETGIGHAAPQHDTQDADPGADTPSTGPADIEMVMEEIAAAVVQSGDGNTPVDIEAMKAELIAAMRAEMKSLLETDLTSVVKSTVATAVSEAVASALADMKDIAAISPPDSAEPTSLGTPVKKP